MRRCPAAKIPDLQGLIQPEIAERLNRPLATVAWLMRGGLMRVREGIDQDANKGVCAPTVTSGWDRMKVSVSGTLRLALRVHVYVCDRTYDRSAFAQHRRMKDKPRNPSSGDVPRPRSPTTHRRASGYVLTAT
jgi:hypothetical protein